ncbi:MAG: hypothetical protein AAF727_13915 [Pseudomonadota bacterium]
MRRALCALTTVAAMLCAPLAHAQEAWSVVLTKKQAEAFAEAEKRQPGTAFAVSPDGAWGWSTGFSSAELAGKRAVQFCRAFLRKRKRDCALYAVNGQRVAPATVQLRRVADVYVPLNGRKAGAILGRAAFQFQGNRAAARAQLAAAPATRAQMREDSALRGALIGRTIMTTQTRGFAVTLEEQSADHAAGTQNGIIKRRFDSWGVTPEGLLCMFNGRWDGTGAPVGRVCLILNAIGNGLVDLSWDQTPNASRKGQLIAGDARYAAVKY